MAEAFAKQLSKMGVNKAFTLVNWKDTNLIPYFASLGFIRADFLALQLDV
ncbi:MAG: hypothetical protein C4554_00810 [Dethiobacter sp.]|jgi:N-acetylglutamate synthase-like GNAT family acetyltransferase|nr:MAG: hypothetical protein C4554_00810 [Dethiobacter sp.]